MRTTFPDVFIGEPPRSLYAVRTQLAQGNYVKIGRILQKCLLQSQYILRINITKIIYIEFRVLQKGSGGQLNCFYGLSLFSIRFKFRKFETCATGHSLQLSHLGAIKNLLRNFAVQNCSGSAAVKTGFTDFHFFPAASSFPEGKLVQQFRPKKSGRGCGRKDRLHRYVSFCPSAACGLTRKSIFPKSADSPNVETFYFYEYRILAHLEN